MADPFLLHLAMPEKPSVCPNLFPEPCRTLRGPSNASVPFLKLSPRKKTLPLFPEMVRARNMFVHDRWVQFKSQLNPKLGWWVTSTR